MSTGELAVAFRSATTASDLRAFALLTREYHDWLGEDLRFQDFEKELASLPGCYAPPAGEILVASVAETDSSWTDVGAVALRPVQVSSIPGCCGSAGPLCEVKRLFVRPSSQGKRIGQQLMEKIMEAAEEKGYAGVVLDTLERLSAANRLYSRLGFNQCAPYYENPLPGVIYWYKTLSRDPSKAAAVSPSSNVEAVEAGW